MGILAGSGSFTRYRIVEEVTPAKLAQAPELLRKNSFRDIDAGTDERSFGWVCLDDWLDPQWRTAPPEKGHFLAMSLRLDTRRISPAVFKKHVLLAFRAEKEAAKDQGKKFIGKDRKTELRDQVRLKLMARALPIPAVFDAVWDTLTHAIWLASTNGKVRALFEDLFTQTFELHLEPQGPFFLARRLLEPARIDDLEEIEPSPFTPL